MNLTTNRLSKAGGGTGYDRGVLSTSRELNSVNLNPLETGIAGVKIDTTEIAKQVKGTRLDPFDVPLPSTINPIVLSDSSEWTTSHLPGFIDGGNGFNFVRSNGNPALTEFDVIFIPTNFTIRKNDEFELDIRKTGGEIENVTLNVRFLHVVNGVDTYTPAMTKTVTLRGTEQTNVIRVDIPSTLHDMNVIATRVSLTGLNITGNDTQISMGAFRIVGKEFNVVNSIDLKSEMYRNEILNRLGEYQPPQTNLDITQSNTTSPDANWESVSYFDDAVNLHDPTDYSNITTAEIVRNGNFTMGARDNKINVSIRNQPAISDASLSVIFTKQDNMTVTATIDNDNIITQADSVTENHTIDIPSSLDNAEIKNIRVRLTGIDSTAQNTQIQFGNIFITTGKLTTSETIELFGGSSDTLNIANIIEQPL